MSCQKNTKKVEQKSKTEYAQIHAAIPKNDNCTSVQIKEYSISLQERKALSFLLQNCAVDNMDNEAMRINTILKNQLDYFCDISVVTYEFVNEEQVHQVIFENCEKTQ